MSTAAVARLALGALLFSTLTGGCREPEPMPLAASAAWLVESAPVAAGNPFELVLFIRTPPDHRVHAYALPELDGIDVVERRILPTATDEHVGVHREAFIARTRGTGLHLWPASEVRVTDAAGRTYPLVLEALEFDVPSVLGEGAPPRRPRGYRPAPGTPSGAPFGLGFAAGALAAGAVALVVLRRERLREGRSPTAMRSGGPGKRRYFGGSGRLGRRLARARADLERDLEASASDAACALRYWAADRFLVSTHAPSAAELRRMRPIDADAELWSLWIDRLDAIEQGRFAAASPSARVDALTRAIEDALAFAARADRPARRGRKPS